MSKRPRMYASFVQTLIYYDEPVLALLQNRKSTWVVAYAADQPVNGFEAPFIAKPTDQKILDLYVDQKVDLNFLMRARRSGEPYIFDWAGFDKQSEVAMTPAENVIDDLEPLYPEQGIFARNHTSRLHGKRISPLYKHAYNIDGRWSASDFSRFYAKLSDLYGVFSYLEEMKDVDGPLSDHLASVISDYPFQRGGSYLGFFRDVVKSSRGEYPLQVSKIQYASPGQIEVRGVAGSLEHIDALIAIFDDRKDKLLEIYNSLHGALKKERLLGSALRDFSNVASEKFAGERSDELITQMEVGDPVALRKACGDHAVTYSKIALAIFRRGADFYKFHEEGRMRLPNDRPFSKHA